MSSQFEVKLINIQRACINAEAAVKSYREAAFESAVQAAIPRHGVYDGSYIHAKYMLEWLLAHEAKLRLLFGC